MNPRDLKAEIEKYTENHDLQKISTIYSDELYPWTAGKAPWSVEQGGTGIVPTGARNDKGLRRGFMRGAFVPNVDTKEGIVKKTPATSFQSLDPSNLEGDIKTVNELKQCLTLMQSLLKKSESFAMKEVAINEKEDVTLLISEVDATLEVLKNTQFKESNQNQSNHRSPTISNNRRSIKRERSSSPQQPLLHRNPSPPRGYKSPTKSYPRSPPEHYNSRFSRSPHSNGRSSRDYDDYGRNSDSGKESRSNRSDRDKRYSNDRYRDRDDYDRRDARDRHSRR